MGVTVSACASGSFCALAKTRGGLIAYGVKGEPDEQGNLQIDADFDADGIADKLLWFRTGSASLIPPDPSRATLILSSTGKTHSVQDQRVQVVKYMGRYHVVTSSSASEKGPWRRTAYLVGSKGLSKLCSFNGRGVGP
jgi:hypothetical protein